jgi:hypothetical protein
VSGQHNTLTIVCKARRKDNDTPLAVLCTGPQATGGLKVNNLSATKGTRVYWRDDAADSGIVTDISWDAVTITWDNGQVARVHHGDMRDIHPVATKTHTAQKRNVAVANTSVSSRRKNT